MFNDVPDQAFVPPQAGELAKFPLQSQFRKVDVVIVGFWLGAAVGAIVKERGEVGAGVVATVGERVGMPATFENEFMNAHAALASTWDPIAAAIRSSLVQTNIIKNSTSHQRPYGIFVDIFFT